MKVRTLKLSLIVFLAVHFSPALAATDQRLLPTTRSEITDQIVHLPINSPTQMTILLRAKHAYLLDTAYTQYTLLWNKNPKNPYINLLRGLSAEFFWQDSMDLRLQPLYGIHSSRTDLFPVAKYCLKMAADSVPQFAEAKMEYGYYLWQFDDETQQGLSLLKQASELAPKDPTVHALLGLVYSNNTGNAYSVKQAIAELKRAAQIDPSYAFPHALLERIYNWQHQDIQSRKEHLIFESLLPRNAS
ncbi:MAG: hypothetical protein ACRYFS_14170 [Janthinobacterium lividum]